MARKQLTLFPATKVEAAPKAPYIFFGYGTYGGLRGIRVREEVHGASVRRWLQEAGSAVEAMNRLDAMLATGHTSWRSLDPQAEDFGAPEARGRQGKVREFYSPLEVKNAYKTDTFLLVGEEGGNFLEEAEEDSVAVLSLEGEIITAAGYEDLSSWETWI